MRDGHEERRRKAKDDTGETVEVVKLRMHACGGDSLGGLGCLYVGLGEARGPEAPWWLTLLRPASYLDSKVNVGMSPRLGTRRGRLLD